MKYTLNELRDTIVPMILSAGDEKQARACADEIIKHTHKVIYARLEKEHADKLAAQAARRRVVGVERAAS